MLRQTPRRAGLRPRLNEIKETTKSPIEEEQRPSDTSSHLESDASNAQRILQNTPHQTLIPDRLDQSAPRTAGDTIMVPTGPRVHGCAWVVMPRKPTEDEHSLTTEVPSMVTDNVSVTDDSIRPDSRGQSLSISTLESTDTITLSQNEANQTGKPKRYRTQRKKDFSPQTRSLMNAKLTAARLASMKALGNPLFASRETIQLINHHASQTASTVGAVRKSKAARRQDNLARQVASWKVKATQSLGVAGRANQSSPKGTSPSPLQSQHLTIPSRSPETGDAPTITGFGDLFQPHGGPASFFATRQYTKVKAEDWDLMLEIERGITDDRAGFPIERGEKREPRKSLRSMLQKYQRFHRLQVPLTWGEITDKQRPRQSTRWADGTVLAERMQLVECSLVVTTTDDRPLVVYWKGAAQDMFTGTTVDNIHSNVTQMFSDLSLLIPPTIPTGKDRHDGVQPAIDKFGSHNVGLYHWARWVAQRQSGIQPPVISGDILQGGAEKMEYIRNALETLAPAHQVNYHVSNISSWP